MESQVSWVTAFLAGVLSFVSPCVLPLIPAYLSYISGLSVQELKDGDRLSAEAKRRIFFRSLAFVAGFSVVFIVLGATATVLSRFLASWTNILMRVAGVIIVIFGVHTAGWIRIPFLYYEKRFPMRTGVASFFSVMLMGAAFAFGWTPCVGPILAAILAQAARQETVGLGIFLLVLYSAGLGLPFVLSGLALSRFFSFIGRMRKYFHVIEVASGILLILIGILVFFGSLSMIAEFFFRVFPFLGGVG